MNIAMNIHGKRVLAMAKAADHLSQRCGFVFSPHKWPLTAKKVILRFLHRPLDCAVGGKEGRKRRRLTKRRKLISQIYRVGQVVMDRGCVDFGKGIAPSLANSTTSAHSDRFPN